MNVFDEGRELLSLSAHNPVFLEKYSIIKESLVNYVDDDLKKMEEAQKLADELSYKALGYKGQSVDNAFRTFRYGIRHEVINRAYLEKVGIDELLFAREVAKEFCKVSNYTLKKGMHSPNNNYTLQHVVDLGKKFLDEYKQGIEERWDTYYQLRDFLLLTSKKHLIDISKLGQIIELIKIVDNEILNVHDKYRHMEELRIFSKAGTTATKINIQEVCNRFFHMFLTDVLNLNKYYKEVLLDLENKHTNKEIDDEEFDITRRAIIEGYRFIDEDINTDPITVIETLSTIMQTKGNILPLLVYSSDEIISAYKLCREFLDEMTDKQVAEKIIDYRRFKTLLVINANYEGIEVKGLDTLAKINKHTLDLLLKANMITLDEYYHYYRDIFKIDRWV